MGRDATEGTKGRSSAARLVIIFLEVRIGKSQRCRSTSATSLARWPPIGCQRRPGPIGLGRRPAQVAAAICGGNSAGGAVVPARQPRAVKTFNRFCKYALFMRFKQLALMGLDTIGVLEHEYWDAHSRATYPSLPQSSCRVIRTSDTRVQPLSSRKLAAVGQLAVLRRLDKKDREGDGPGNSLTVAISNSG